MSINPSQVKRSPDFWTIASEGLSLALREKVDVDELRLWAKDQTKVELLQALQPDTEHKAQAQFKGMTFAERVEARRRRKNPDKDRLKQLEKAIVRSFGRSDEARNRLIIIARVIEAANVYRLSPLPIPVVPRRLVRETNPFEQGRAVNAIRTMRSLRQVCQAWIKSIDPPEISTDSTDGEGCFFGAAYGQEVPIGLIVLSAVLEGDLLHRTSVESLGLQLNRPECPLRWWGETPSAGRARPVGQFSRSFIDLTLRYGTTEDAELRRWFPDPQTASLIARAYFFRGRMVAPDDDARTVMRLIWRQIENGIINHGEKSGVRPRTLDSVLTTVRLALFADNYPAVVVGYCARRLVCHSVRSSVLPRLTGNGHSGELVEPARLQGPTASPRTLSLERADEVSVSRWYSDLLHAFKGRTKRQVKKDVEHLSTSLFIARSSVRSFVDFPSFLIENGSAAGRKLAISTVRNYASLVARYLGGCLRSEDPSTIPHAELIALYGDALDLVDQGQSATSMRRRLGRALSEFHHYLVRRYRIQGVDPGTVFGIGRDLVPVDANLLTPDEYFDVRDKVVQLVQQQNMRREIADIALVLLSLGFWLGLRRTEARGLRTIDVCDLGVPMLIVRPWEGRRLKTKSCSRVLPLTLLPEEELLKLVAWTEKRRRDADRGDDQYLFGVPRLAQDVVRAEVFDVVQQAMRTVTGDSSLRYHHLRHSAASWSFLRLCISDFLNAPNPFPMLTKTTELLRDSPRFRAAVYNALPPEGSKPPYEPKSRDFYALDGPIRQHAFAVARLLGHASPGTTLEHYIHFLDLVVPMYRRSRTFFALKPQHAFCASAYSDSSGYRHGVEELPAEVWRHLPDELKRASPQRQVETTSTEPDSEFHWTDRIWRMLFAADTEQLPASELGADYNLTASQVDVLLARARELKGKLLHRMTCWTPDRRRPKDRRELSCPRNSRLEQDLRLIARLENSLFGAIANDRGRVERVLEYFVKHQNGFGRVGPLYFDEPDNPDRAIDYLGFLQDLGLRRLSIEKRGTNQISTPSEIRFVCYDAAVRQRWRDALPLKTRDDLWPKRGSEEKRPPNLPRQGIGILAHLGVAPTEPTVGSFGFRFFMLMAWIAWPWLVNRNGCSDGPLS